MATYITLMKFTDQGIRSVKDTVKRSEEAGALAKQLGVSLKSIHWTLGQYDVVAEWEAADEAAFTAFGLSIGSMGNVKTETMRAFDRSEMAGILGKVQ